MVRTQWVSLYGQNNRVDHCYFEGKTNRGAMVQNIRTEGAPPDNNMIDHNYFGDRPYVEEGGIELELSTMQIGTTGKNAYRTAGTIVEYNYFYKINSSGNVILLKSSGSTVRHNVIDSSQGKIMLRQGNNNVVEGNFIHGRGIDGTRGISIRGKGHLVVNNHIRNTRSSSGIGIQPGDAKIDPDRGYYHYPRAEDVTIAFNTIVNNSRSIEIGAGRGTEPPRDIRFLNNIVSSGNGPLVREDIAARNMDMSSNIMWGSDVGMSNSSGYRVVDPKLRADSRGVFRPDSSSPAIGAAERVSEIAGNTRDIDQQLRSLPYDIGADEYDSRSTGVRQISKCNVGPQTYMVDKSCSRNAPPKPPVLISVVN